MQNILVQQTLNNSNASVNIASLITNKGATIANISYVTQVKTAAAHKHMRIVKISKASVMLASNLQAYTNMYLNKVQKTATTDASNFVTAPAHFTHTACYSVVHNANLNTHYLFALFNNNSKSIYVNLANNTVLTKDQVAQYLTASAAKQLLQSNATVHNKTNNITHSAIVRTIKLANIVSISINKQVVNANFVYNA